MSAETRIGEPLVIVEIVGVGDGAGAAATVTFNRPAQLNALDWETVLAFDAAIDSVAADPEVRAVLVTGAGRAFSAGGDLVKYLELYADADRYPRFIADFHRVLGRLRELPVPVVALVNGVAAAGGLEVILACDLAIAAAGARLGDAHVNYGQMGGGGVLTLLPRLVGIQRAAEMIFSGRFLDATEAAACGLVARVVPDDRLLAEGLAVAASYAGHSRAALRVAKETMVQIWATGASLADGLAEERRRNVEYCLTEPDAREGLAAFADKRTPNYRSR
jgi:enoyl-CoA hydratase/carnithine racemase